MTHISPDVKATENFLRERAAEVLEIQDEITKVEAMHEDALKAHDAYIREYWKGKLELEDKLRISHMRVHYATCNVCVAVSNALVDATNEPLTSRETLHALIARAAKSKLRNSELDVPPFPRAEWADVILNSLEKSQRFGGFKQKDLRRVTLHVDDACKKRGLRDVKLTEKQRSRIWTVLEAHCLVRCTKGNGEIVIAPPYTQTLTQEPPLI